jgi:hypothetical protein
MNEGFPWKGAPHYADVVVLLEFRIGVALLIGAVLARPTRGASPPSYQNVSRGTFRTMARNPRGLHRRY